MGKRVRFAVLKQGGTEIVVQVKTTTENYMRKLIADYKKIGRLSAGEVEWELI